MSTKTQSNSRAAKPGNSILRGGVAGAFLTPATILIFIFLFIPAGWTLFLGITDYKLTGITAQNQKIIGLANFQKALQDPAFLNALKVTIQFTLGSAIFGQAVLGFLLAWILSTVTKRVRSAVELIVICAWIVPSSVVSFLWVAFLNGDQGTLNLLTGLKVQWLINYPLQSIIVFNTWRGTAFSMLLFTAAIAAIPKSHLEVARISGATKFQQLRTVILPSARPYILTNLLLISLWTFNDFGPYLITGGGPGQKSELLSIFVYNSALRYLDFGYGSAIAAIMLTLNLIISLIVVRLGRKQQKK